MPTFQHVEVDRVCGTSPRPATTLPTLVDGLCYCVTAGSVTPTHCLPCSCCAVAAPGEPCEMHGSTCGGRNELCHGRGPAWPDDTASTAAIAQLQADKAQQLWQAPGTAGISGPIDHRHTYINMSSVTVSSLASRAECVTSPEDSIIRRLCHSDCAASSCWATARRL